MGTVTNIKKDNLIYGVTMFSLAIIALASVLIQWTTDTKLSEKYLMVYSILGIITFAYFLSLVLAIFIKGEENYFPGFLAQRNKLRILSNTRWKWLVLIIITLIFILIPTVTGKSLFPPPQPYAGAETFSQAQEFGVSAAEYAYYVSFVVAIFENAVFLMLIPSTIVLMFSRVFAVLGALNPITFTGIAAIASTIGAAFFSKAHGVYSGNQAAFAVALIFGFFIAFAMQITGTFWIIAHLLHNLLVAIGFVTVIAFAAAFMVWNPDLMKELKNFILLKIKGGIQDAK